MKVTLYSNFMNHHHLPFCEAMYKRLGTGYTFVATTPTDKERLNMGYADMNDRYPFILMAYGSESNAAKAMELALESDVIITGSAPEIYTSERIKLNKLTFRYSERIYKRGVWRAISPRGFYFITKKHTRYRNKNLYMLCASAYTAGDLAMLGAYKNKTVKWGYFPEVKTHDINGLIGEKNQNTVEILWTGRFLDWKHPEKAIYVAKQLTCDGYDFKMKIIGAGEQECNLRALIDELNLNDRVTVLGAMPPEKVREYMEHANIFLFTSNYQEGWGAVLNEAMNSGCAIVASHAAGSVPFLLKHGETGLVYKYGRDEDLYAQVRTLMDDTGLRKQLGHNAYCMLQNEWNAEVAAERFLGLCEGLLGGAKMDFKTGPGSVAVPVPEWKMYKSLMGK